MSGEHLILATVVLTHMQETHLERALGEQLVELLQGLRGLVQFGLLHSLGWWSILFEGLATVHHVTEEIEQIVD